MNERPVVSQDFTNPVPTVGAAANAARAGSLYYVSTGAIALTLAGFVVLQLTNPASSTKNLFIARFMTGTSASATFDLLRNATFAAAGTTLTPRNANFASPDASVATAKFINQATDPTTGGQLLASLVQTDAALADYNGALVVTPGSTIALRASNITLTLTLSLNATWWEA